MSTTPDDLIPWPADAPEADAAEQQREAYPEPALEPEEARPALAALGLADADEGDLVEQSRELPWEDGDEER